VLDREIVDKFWNRDESALKDVQSAYYHYCYHIAFKIVGNKQDAEECFNDVLLFAWRSMPPHRPENLKLFLGKMIREHAIDCLRKRMAQKRNNGCALLSLDELSEYIGENEEDFEIREEELAKHISAFLRTISEDDRNVFIRRYWYFDSIDEICDRFGFGKSRVLMKLKRTRDRLAQYLRREGYHL